MLPLNKGLGQISSFLFLGSSLEFPLDLGLVSGGILPDLSSPQVFLFQPMDSKFPSRPHPRPSPHFVWAKLQFQTGLSSLSKGAGTESLPSGLVP